METNKLSIIIPVFNEEEVVNEILNEIYDSFKDVESYEIILVDDGSKNDISEFIDESLNKDNLIILRNDFNIGHFIVKEVVKIVKVMLLVLSTVMDRILHLN